MDCLCFWIIFLNQKLKEWIEEIHIINFHKKGACCCKALPLCIDLTEYVDYFNSISLFNKASLLAISHAVWNTSWARLAISG